MLSFWFGFTFLTCISIALFIRPAICADDSSTPSYKDHCSSVVPQSSTGAAVYKDSLPLLTTPYFTGGDQLLTYGGRNNHTFYYTGKFLRLRILPTCHQTVDKRVYKIVASLYFYSPYASGYDDARNDSYPGYYFRRRRSRGSIRFTLTGFWSEDSRKACMVGSANLHLGEHGTLNVAGVLKLKFADERPNLRTAVVSGTFRSTSRKGAPGYFDPVSIFSSPDVPNYKYSILPEDAGSLGGFNVSKGKPLNLKPDQFCHVLWWKWIFFGMEYAAECSDPRNCSPLGNGSGAMPGSLYLSPIECSKDERRMRYIATFKNHSYVDDTFSFESTLVAEGSWNDKNDQMFIKACRVLDPLDHFGDGVGDCEIRLILRYPSVWTIHDDLRIVGQLWSKKLGNETGYFRKIKLTSDDVNDVAGILAWRYNYTEMERVQKLCPKPRKKGKENYPDGKSFDMRFDVLVQNSEGQRVASGYAMPISVGNETYQGNNMYALAPMSSDGLATVSDSEIIDRVPIVNISYKVVINPDNENLNMSLHLNRYHQVEITAEGVYNGETGQLCMVGCRKLQNSSMDCQILVKFDFAPLNMRKGDRIKGTIKSLRQKDDASYFQDLTMSAAAYYVEMAEESVWRMDLEITLVLISNTLFCIFIALQIFHVKRNPEIVSSISLVMVMILALGHMIPLILNIEAVFLDNHRKQTVFLSSGGWLEENEVAVRVIMMVAFLLQIRLLQLVWTAKQSGDNNKSPWNGERKASFITLPLYILGALFALLLNWMRNRYGYENYSLWGDLRSYAGLILDGFLLPQMVLNAVRGSNEKALSHRFYVGTSAVRIVPHAYNQYRAHSYPEPFVNGTYYYANPAADFTRRRGMC